MIARTSTTVLCHEETGPNVRALVDDQDTDFTARKRPQDQSNKEWLADLGEPDQSSHCTADQYRGAKSGEPIPISESDKSPIITTLFDALPQSNRRPHFNQPTVAPSAAVDIPPANRLLFRYIDHRTTRKGSVVLVFESLDGRTRASAFFNASLESNRGTKYPSGKRGQFIPPEMGKFRGFWMETVGKEPSRWSRVHKSMRSNFRDIVFTGEVTEERDGKDQHYFKLRDVKPAK